MKRLLIVYHTQFGGTAQMADAAHAGARTIDDVDTVRKRAADAGVEDLLGADALLIATSENFGGMAGMVKDFLERVYYPCEGRLEGRPYAVLVCAGTDGAGAMRDVDRVATGLRLSKVHPGLVHRSGRTAQAQTIPDDVLARCGEIGATLAAGLSAGIY
jgi:NAD(P)H-dependent FMN reductase